MRRRVGFMAMALVGLPVLLMLGAQRDAGAASAAENTLPPMPIVNRTGIKVVIQVNSKATLPSGVSKQVLAAKMLYNEYKSLNMKNGKDYQIVMVFRAGGSQFLLNDRAYDSKVKQPHPKGNPSSAVLRGLHKAGVKMYECHVAMKMKGYKPQDLLPFSRMVVSGMGAVIDFEKSGYALITP